MANVKITELTALTDPASSDVLPIVDVGADTTKKVTIADLLENAGDGAAATPAFSFDNDKNTGIYRPGTDQLALVTGGTSRLFIDSSGNVGINNSSPSSYNASADNLVVGSTGDNGITIATGTGSQGSLFFADGTSGSAVAEGYLIYVHSSNYMALGTGNAERLRIDSSGRLLVGTTTEGHANADNLTIADTGNCGITLRSGTTSSGFIYFSDATSGTDEYDGYIHYSHNTRALRFATAASEAARINSSGQMVIGGTSALDSTKQLTLTSTTTSGGLGILSPNNGRGDIFFGDAADDNVGQIKYSHVDDSLTIRTNAADRFTIDSSGRCGIGTTSPQRALVVSDAGDEGFEFFPGSGDTENTLNHYDRGSSSFIDIINNADQHIFGRADGQKMRLDGAGRLLIGTSTSNDIFQESQLQIEGNTSAKASLSLHQNQSAVDGPQLILGKSRGSGSVGSSDILGDIVFAGNDGTDVNSRGAIIRAKIDGTPGSNDLPTHLAFMTTADGAASPTERMRIDSLARITLGSQTDPSVVTEPPVTNYFTSATPTTNDTAGTGTWAANASIAPDGTKTASKFTAGSTPAQSRFSQVSSSVNLNSTAYTLSFYAKSESGSSQSINVDLGDDQAGSITVTTSWQRFVFTSLVPTSGRFIDFGGIDGNWSLWGVQIQTESAATSYVKPSGGVATTSAARATVGTRFSDYSDLFVAGNAQIDGTLRVNDALTSLTRNNNIVLDVNRLSSDGKLVKFLQDNTEEGDISVSGSTVSLNGAHLTRWSQLANGAERTEILRGSVLSNLDEMCEWQYGAQAAVLYTEEDELPEGVNVGDVKVPAVEASVEDNEQLNRMKVSDVEGDRNVAGVFQAWDDDDDTYTNDFYCAMTGDFVIRIAQGTTVARGDLLMSAGDGTAKPQDDDIVRSKTIAKVTSTTVSTTYADGSYCVPCVLMAC